MPPEYQVVLIQAWMDALRLMGLILLFISGASVLVILLCAAVNLAEAWLSRRDARAPGVDRVPTAIYGRATNPRWWWLPNFISPPLREIYGAQPRPISDGTKRRGRESGQV